MSVSTKVVLFALAALAVVAGAQPSRRIRLATSVMILGSVALLGAIEHLLFHSRHRFARPLKKQSGSATA
ncbi:MAG: hypothetical protein M3214_07870 [Actinomycetota bacterium]|nr:hypothetical protein [Actinomycetota bacterium]